MYVQVFQLPIGNCARVPHYLFRGEHRKPLKVLKVPLEFSIAGQAWWRNRNWRRWFERHRLPKPVYLYPDPARTHRAVGAIAVARVEATVNNPTVEIYHDDGVAVALDGRVVFSFWHPTGTRRSVVRLPMRKGQVSVLRIYWFDYCCTGDLIVIPHGLKEAKKRKMGAIAGIAGIAGAAMIALGLARSAR